jgi:hypothetical protein
MLSFTSIFEFVRDVTLLSFRAFYLCVVLLAFGHFGMGNLFFFLVVLDTRSGGNLLFQVQGKGVWNGGMAWVAV